MIHALKDTLMYTDLMKRKLQILTLALPSWIIERMATEFNVSVYLVKKALRKSPRGLTEIDIKKGKKLSQETVNKVIAFSDSDEYSRMYPGQNEFKSVKDESVKKTPKQKRLLLVNLRELYTEFQEKGPSCNEDIDIIVSM